MKIRALAALAPLFALAACTADNNASVQTFAICAPPDECVFSGRTCEKYTLASLMLDVRATNHYRAFLEVHNQMAENADPSSGRPNTRDAYVEEYSVEYEMPVGLSQLPSFTKRLEHGPVVIEPGGTAIIALEPITVAEGGRLGMEVSGTLEREVLAKVRLRGVLTDQSSFETGEFPIPIQVCAGCVGAPLCEDPAEIPIGFCPDNLGQWPLTPICP